MRNRFFFYLISLFSYLLAITQPLFTTSGEIIGISFKKESFTFFKSLDLLKEQNHIELSYTLFFFVIILPTLKYLTLLFNIFNKSVINKQVNNIILYLQKYAMVDVFVIALILIASKNNPLFIMKIELGTYALILSVLASMTLSIKMKFGKTWKNLKTTNFE